MGLLFYNYVCYYSSVIWKKTWHAKIERKLCQENSALAYKLSLLFTVNARIIIWNCFFACIISILVCKSLNGKTCQYSNNTFKKQQKSFSFAKLNSQTCEAKMETYMAALEWLIELARWIF
jgi:hypothetical protein